MDAGRGALQCRAGQSGGGKDLCLLGHPQHGRERFRTGRPTRGRFASRRATLASRPRRLGAVEPFQGLRRRNLSQIKFSLSLFVREIGLFRGAKCGREMRLQETQRRGRFARKAAKRKAHFATRNEAFRMAARKSLESLLRRITRFAVLFVFRGLTRFRFAVFVMPREASSTARLRVVTRDHSQHLER